MTVKHSPFDELVLLGPAARHDKGPQKLPIAHEIVLARNHKVILVTIESVFHVLEK